MYNNLCNLDRLGAVKLELVSLALSSTAKTSNKEELRNNLILINKLIKRAKEDQNSVELNEIKSIENFALNTRKGR